MTIAGRLYSRRDPHHVQRRVIHHEIASVSFKAVDDPSIDTRSCTGKLVMGILVLIAEFENDIRRERQMDGIAKAKDRVVKFGRKREFTELTEEKVEEIRALRDSGEPAIVNRSPTAARATS